MLEFICTLPVLAAFFQACEPPPPLALGYVEGEYVLVAPIETARVVTLDVARGDRVAPGDPLATLERRDAEIAVAEAEAQLARSESELADLRQGSRDEEIRRTEASLASAKVELQEATREVERDRNLLNRGVLSQAQFDTAETKMRIAEAHVREMEASLAVMLLPARADRIKAAEAAMAQAEALLEQAQWRLDQRSLTAPVPGQVTDILRFAGELAGPSAPVVSILPEGAVKLRFFLPEASLALVERGTQVRGTCDGCAAPVLATVSYIADSPEFTPPVIYSLGNRQKLVYLVEARPDPGQHAPKPGQIVDVYLAGPDR